MPEGDIAKNTTGGGGTRAHTPRRSGRASSGSASPRRSGATGSGGDAKRPDEKLAKAKIRDDAALGAPQKPPRSRARAASSDGTAPPSESPVPQKAKATCPSPRDETARLETPVDPGAEPQAAEPQLPAVKPRRQAKGAEPRHEAAPGVSVVEAAAEVSVVETAGVPPVTAEAAPAHGEDSASQPLSDVPQQASEPVPATAHSELDALLRELRDTVTHLRGTADLRSQTDLALAAVVQQQQAMVVRLHQAARRAQSVEVLRHMVMQFLRETHVRVVTSIEDAALFPGVGAEGIWEVVEPAYVDGQTGRLVQPGTAARVDDVKTDEETQ